MEKITREGRRRRMRKEVVGCVYDLAMKEKFLLPIRIWVEEIYRFFFDLFINFKRGGGYG